MITTHGAWRAVVSEVADKFLACGVLEHGFARVRCDACAYEYLLALSCKARYFCPSCHAKRLALWTLWLEETLLAPVPHRQVVLTIPKRLRTWCLYRRALLGDLARVAARTVTAAVRTLTREPDLAVGVVACIQTHGSPDLIRSGDAASAPPETGTDVLWQHYLVRRKGAAAVPCSDNEVPEVA